MPRRKAGLMVQIVRWLQAAGCSRLRWAVFSSPTTPETDARAPACWLNGRGPTAPSSRTGEGAAARAWVWQAGGRQCIVVREGRGRLCLAAHIMGVWSRDLRAASRAGSAEYTDRSATHASLGSQLGQIGGPRGVGERRTSLCGRRHASGRASPAS